MEPLDQGDGSSSMMLNLNGDQVIAAIETAKGVEYYIRIKAVYENGYAYSVPVPFSY
jgi:hypothetical protein